MSKMFEYTKRGVREIQKTKGCHACAECANLSCVDRRPDRDVCLVRKKSSATDRRFPYDNTKCKEFEPQ